MIDGAAVFGAPGTVFWAGDCCADRLLQRTIYASPEQKNRREAAGDGRLWLVAPLTGEEEGDVPKALALPE